MSTMPPNLIGPILQSHLASRQVSTVRDSERSHQITAQRQQTAAIDEKDSTVETSDGDTQVHADGEGSGSQGRSFTQDQTDLPASDSSADEPADQGGRLIDFEA